MFSVKTENILLNYFLVLLIIGFSWILSFTFAYLLLLFLFLFLGIFLIYDKYYYFKVAFVPMVILAIFLEILFLNSNIVVLILLFISLAQICLLISYITLFLLIFIDFPHFNLFLLIPIFLLVLLFSFFSGFQKLKKDMSSKLFIAETRHLLFRHELCNLYSIVFLKNKDKDLQPVLNKIRESVDFKQENQKSSIAGLLRMSIFFKDYDYNLNVKENYFIYGSNFSWICFFCILFEKYVKKGSSVFVSKEEVIFVLKKGFDSKELNDFLKTQFVKERISIDGNILKFYYGM